MKLEELVERVQKLKVARLKGRPALYQPITLLWAIGRARNGEPRLSPWRDTEQALRSLLERYGIHGERGRPDYPVAALYRAGLWDIPDRQGSVPTAHGDSDLQRWFRDHQPTSGLPDPIYMMMRQSETASAAVVAAVLDIFLEDMEQGELLQELGLIRYRIADTAQ